MTAKRYNRAYFNRWYRRPGSTTHAELRRQVSVALSVAEHLLGHPVRNVLDVGCGEGRWALVLRSIRPRIRYLGVDPSEYVVRRFGRSRNIVQGGLGGLARLSPEEEYDLVVCADVLHYVGAAEVMHGLRQIGGLMRGVGYFEVFTSEDEFSGDRTGWQRRSAAWYRRAFLANGLLPCGMHCYAARPLHEHVAALERGR